MSGLAQLCGFSRRALYHHFSSKEEAFRYWLEFYNHRSIANGRRRLVRAIAFRQREECSLLAACSIRPVKRWPACPSRSSGDRASLGCRRSKRAVSIAQLEVV